MEPAPPSPLLPQVAAALPAALSTRSDVLGAVTSILCNPPADRDFALACALLQGHGDVTDVLWFCGMVVPRDSPAWLALCELVACMFQSADALRPALAHRLELDLLEGAGVIKAEEKKRLVKANTQINYAHVKFNLLNESLLGYANFLLDLFSAHVSVDDILSSIGRFRLDPNRALDLVLDRLACAGANVDALVGVLRTYFTRDGVSQVLGFKLAGGADLFKVAALLLEHNVVALEVVCAHLSPALANFAASAKVQDDHQLAALKQMTKINLSGKPVQPLPAPPAPRDDVSPLIAALLDREAGVCVDIAQRLLDVLRAHGARPHQVQRHPALRASLLGKIRRLLAARSPLGLLSHWLAEAGAVLADDPVLLTRVLRALAQTWAGQPGPAESVVLRALQTCVVPAMAMLRTPNYPLNVELWAVVSRFAFPTRFELYANVDKDVGMDPMRATRRAENAMDTTRVLKRVANEKAALKAATVAIAKQSHMDPMAVFQELLKNVQSYENIIVAVVDALKYVSPYGLDVLAFLLVRTLSGDARSKLKEDGTSRSTWLTSLCKFAGSFYLKFPRVELGALLQVVLGKLVQGESLELLALESVVAKMSGVGVLEDYSAFVLQCSAGGNVLRAQSRMAEGSQLSGSNLSKSRLVAAVKPLFVPLLCAMARQRALVLGALKHDSPLSMLASACQLFDACSASLVQFAEFGALNAICGPQDLPGLDELVVHLHIEPAVALYLTRMLSKVDLAAPSAAVLASRLPVSPQLFCTFWALGFADLHVPEPEYAQETERLKAKAAALQKPDRFSDVTDEKAREAEQKKRVDDANKLKEVINALVAELPARTALVAQVRASMAAECASWFARPAAELDLCQSCVFPRARFSQEEACFAFKFIETLNALRAPNFSILRTLDILFTMLSKAFMSTTDREAANLGVFFLNVFALLWRWRDSAEAFESECADAAAHDEQGAKLLSHQAFVHKARAWHDELGRVLDSAMAKPNVVFQKLGLIVLFNTSSKFPDTVELTRAMQQNLQRIESEHSPATESVKLMARGLATALEKRIRENKTRVAATGEILVYVPPVRAPRPKPAPPSATKPAAALGGGDAAKTAAVAALPAVEAPAAHRTPPVSASRQGVTVAGSNSSATSKLVGVPGSGPSSAAANSLKRLAPPANAAASSGGDEKRIALSSRAPVGATADAPVGATADAPVGATANTPVGATANTPVGATANTPVGATASAPTEDESDGEVEEANGKHGPSEGRDAAAPKGRASGWSARSASSPKKPPPPAVARPPPRTSMVPLPDSAVMVVTDPGLVRIAPRRGPPVERKASIAASETSNAASETSNAASEGPKAASEGSKAASEPSKAGEASKSKPSQPQPPHQSEPVGGRAARPPQGQPRQPQQQQPQQETAAGGRFRRQSEHDEGREDAKRPARRADARDSARDSGRDRSRERAGSYRGAGRGGGGGGDERRSSADRRDRKGR